MNLIGWWYLSLLVLVLCDITLVNSQQQDIQRHNESKNSIDEDVTELRDVILGDSAGIQGRTFGQKRIQFLLMPIIFKLGVMSTLLIVVTAVSLKGLTIGIILLVLKLATLFGKLFNNLQPHGQQAPWLSPAQPVHLYLHNDGYAHSPPFSGWESSGPSEHDNYYYRG